VEREGIGADDTGRPPTAGVLWSACILPAPFPDRDQPMEAERINAIAASLADLAARAAELRRYL
jgi:hypothetical protein